MNDMKKLIMIFNLMAISLIAAAQAYQKETITFSMGAEVLFAESKLSATHHTGFGATPKAEYVFGKHASVTVATGFYFMKAKETPLYKFENILAFPAKAGIRYYLGSFYGSGEAGVVFFTGYNQGTAFAYSLGLGDKINFSNHIIDIGLRHEGWSSADNNNAVISLRLGYEFTILKKAVVNRSL